MSARPSAPEAAQLTGPAGTLEALIETPPAPPRYFAVVCHPHPLHGGTLQNKVVYMLARTLLQQGVAAIRFNFRGIGTSSGQFDEGIGEVADALAVVAYGRTRWPQAGLVLAGFSFGGMVAAQAAASARPQWLVTVAPAVRLLTRPLPQPACPWLLIQGDADDVVDPQQVSDWAKSFAPPPTLKRLPGVGHFFHGRLQDLQQAVAAELPAALNLGPGGP
ncbi:MAG TPA: alpha/beta fold hydrolase [Steroidobacteraceae bacterium]